MASCIPHSRVLVLHVGHHELQDVVELVLHQFVAALANRRNGHQSCVTLLPYRVREQLWNEFKCNGKHGLAANVSGDTVESLLCHHGIRFVVVVFGIIRGFPFRVVFDVGKPAHGERKDGGDEVGLLAHHCRSGFGKSEDKLKGHLASV